MRIPKRLRYIRKFSALRTVARTRRRLRLLPKSQMQGFVDRISPSHVTGWAYAPSSPDRPATVAVFVNGTKLAEGIADRLRPDVAAAVHTHGRHGFLLDGLTLKPSEIATAEIRSRLYESENWQALPRISGKNHTPQYQSFDDAAGASDSAKKLAALRLHVLPNRYDEQTPLRDLAVLDIGCNEGFFCGEALRQGARRVVGVDAHRGFIDNAKKRFPEAEFICTSWWDMPEGKFDVILFLSAIHYEPRARALLQKLATYLTPTGTLIIECGIGNKPGKQWQAVQRADGVRRYPSFAMFTHILMAPYAVRHIGASVMQQGDPVPRQVFFANHRDSIAILIMGPTDSGKSTLAFEFSERNVPSVHTDVMLRSIIGNANYDWSPVAAVVKRNKQSGSAINFGTIGEAIASECPEAFVDLVMLEAPLEAPMVCIEGEILRHSAIHVPLIERLKAASIRVWVARPPT